MKNYLKEKTIHPTIEHIQEAFDRDGYVGMKAEEFYNHLCDSELEIVGGIHSDWPGMVCIHSPVGFSHLMLFKCCLVQIASTEELAQKRILMRMGYQLPEYEQTQIAIEDANGTDAQDGQEH